MKIIDAHTHIFPEKIAKKAAGSIGRFYDLPMYCDASASLLIDSEAAIGCDRCLVCSSAVTADQVESINTFIHEQCQLHPEFFGFGALHRDYENYEEELDRVVSLGLHGIKFHNDFQKFDIDDKKMFPIYKAMAKRKLPVLFHMGDNRYDYSAPEKLVVLLNEVPDLIIIGAHFGGYRRWADVLSLPVTDRLFFDTSSSLAFLEKDMARRIIDRFGIGQFFFGSDFPMWNPKDELDRFLALGYDAAVNRAILHDNFSKLFHLDER